MKKRLAILLVLSAWNWPSYAETLGKETYMVPMRDGVHLATDVIRPADDKPHAVLLYRTPYNKTSLPVPELIVSLLNLKGYALVLQDTRGRYASQGADSVFFTDGWGRQQDGFDTIDWLTRQTWCNAKVAVFGASASGITTYRAVGSLHPAIKCAVAIVAPTDFYHQVVYPGGEYGKELCEGWISKQGSLYMIDYYLRYPYYSSVWDQMNLHTRTDLIRVPMLHIGGWYDCFSYGPIAAFQDLKRHAGIPQKLVMGPWIHGSVGSSSRVGQITYPGADFDILGFALGWFDRWLLGTENDVEKKPAVHYYLMGDPSHPEDGGCRWLDADTWPPEEARTMTYYLSADGALATQKPSEEKTATYSYNPANPVNTLGGNNLNINAGPYDQKSLNSRSDVLGYMSDFLAGPLRLEGYVKGTFYVTSNQPDTDFTLKLMDVYPDGREMLVVDGIARARFRDGVFESLVHWLQPDTVGKITISLPPTAIVISKGHRIKVALSSSNYQRFDKNPNTANAPNDRTVTQISMNTIYTGGAFASSVELPLIGQLTDVENGTKQPSGFQLSAAFPNPFNNDTQWRYQTNSTTTLQIDVYAVNGTLVQTLWQGRQNSGEHTIVWNGRDQRGNLQPSGLYMIRFVANNQVHVQKAMLVR